MDFKPIQASDNANYGSYAKQCIHIPCDCSPAVMYAYRTADHLERAYQDGFAWQRSNGADPFYMPPMGDWDIDNWKDILEANIPDGTVFRYVPEYLMNVWVKQIPLQIDFQSSRDDWDYVIDFNRFETNYSKHIKETIKAHQKFIETYHPEIKSVGIEALDDILAIHEARSAEIRAHTTNVEELDKEDESLRTLLASWANFDSVFAYLVTIEQKPVGFMILEAVDENTVIALFQKADMSFKNIIAYMDVEIFHDLKQQDYLVANIMSDVGVSGLRSTKEHMSPLTMIKKYMVTYHR